MNWCATPAVFDLGAATSSSSVRGRARLARYGGWTACTERPATKTAMPVRAGRPPIVSAARQRPAACRARALDAPDVDPPPCDRSELVTAERDRASRAGVEASDSVRWRNSSVRSILAEQRDAGSASTDTRFGGPSSEGDVRVGFPVHRLCSTRSVDSSLRTRGRSRRRREARLRVRARPPCVRCTCLRRTPSAATTAPLSRSIAPRSRHRYAVPDQPAPPCASRRVSHVDPDEGPRDVPEVDGVAPPFPGTSRRRPRVCRFHRERLDRMANCRARQRSCRMRAGQRAVGRTSRRRVRGRAACTVALEARPSSLICRRSISKRRPERVVFRLSGVGRTARREFRAECEQIIVESSVVGSPKRPSGRAGHRPRTCRPRFAQDDRAHTSSVTTTTRLRVEPDRSQAWPRSSV